MYTCFTFSSKNNWDDKLEWFTMPWTSKCVCLKNIFFVFSKGSIEGLTFQKFAFCVGVYKKKLFVFGLILYISLKYSFTYDYMRRVFECMFSYKEFDCAKETLCG